MKKLIASFLLVFLITGYASAASFLSGFMFEGTIDYHNDVVQIGFTLDDDARDVDLWTDSFMNGINFDPIIALWNADTGALIAQNDDNDGIALGQTQYDSGIELGFLSSGNYFFTIVGYDNFALGSNISDGFSFDGDTPIALANWCQPFNSCGMGDYWRINYSAKPVPLPAAVWLFATGLLGLVGVSKRKMSRV